MGEAMLAAVQAQQWMRLFWLLYRLSNGRGDAGCCTGSAMGEAMLASYRLSNGRGTAGCCTGSLECLREAPQARRLARRTTSYNWSLPNLLLNNANCSKTGSEHHFMSSGYVLKRISTVQYYALCCRFKRNCMKKLRPACINLVELCFAALKCKSRIKY